MSFRIAMVGLDELKPHEEVMDQVVRSLANELSNEGQLHDPLVVDQEDYVILDGMHRFKSLKLLECRFVPCCLVDYDSAQIKVGSWWRAFAVDETDSLAEKLLAEASLNYSKRQVELATMAYDPQTIILTRSGAVFSLPNQLDPIQRAKTSVGLERTMGKTGRTVTYLSESVALQQLKSGEVNFVISVPIFTKQQIRECGLGGHLLPHKVTRHIMPSRPLGIDVPLQLLTDPKISREEANRELGKLLGQRHIDRKPPGSMIDGRRYEEELLLFSA